MTLHAPDLRPGGLAKAAICETRVGKPDDLAFVVDCWTQRELRDGDGSRSLGDLKRHVRALLGVPDVKTHDLPPQLERLLIAHVVGDPDSILGWTAYERGSRHAPPCVHYIYVRTSARRMGIARTLVGNVATLEYSHTAPKGVVVPSGWTFNGERART